MTDTIAAIATPLIPSAIGILRLSGPSAIAVVDRVFTPLRGKPMAERPDRTLVYGTLRDEDGQELDQCLATISRGPHSYTGEDTAELQCHGSPAMLTLGLEALFAAGARQALAGEFTKRAFLNGRLDLTEAEAVIDLIDARSAPAVRTAASQLGGALRNAVDEIYDGLTDLMAHFHAVLDYPDEDIAPFEASEIADALTQAGAKLNRLRDSYRRGRLLTEGARCAIVGRPNAGKSTLFNALLGRERAIVTATPGTTRDTVEELVTLGGVLLRLTDTAGVRETADEVERLGVERSKAAMAEAELTLVLIDGSKPWVDEDEELLRNAAAHGRAVLVYTKADLPPAQGTGPRLPEGVPQVTVSAATGAGLDELEQAVAACFPGESGARPGVVLTNARQAESAKRAGEAVTRAAQALADGLSPDAVLTDVEEAMEALGEMTGRSVRADITDRIFQRFCVGK